MQEKEPIIVNHLKFVSVTTLFSSLIVTSLLWYFIVQDYTNQLAVMSGVSTLITLILVISTASTYYHHHLVGVWLLILSLISAIPIAAVFLSGFGIPLIISASLTIFIIVIQALPRHHLIGASVLMGLSVLSTLVMNMVGTNYQVAISEQSMRSLGNLQTGVITIFMLIVMREAIQRRQAEYELKDQNTNLLISEQKYRQLVESAKDIVYTTEANGRITYINPIAAKWAGYPQEQLIGMHFTSLLASDWQTRVKDFYDRQWQQRIQETTYEFPVQVSGEFRRWAQQRTSLLVDADGQLIGFHSVIRDISKSKMMEEALQSQLVKTEAMYQMARSLISYSKLPELLQVTINATASAVSADRAILYTFDLENKVVPLFVTGGLHADKVVSFTFEELMAGLNGWVMRSGKPALALKDEEDERFSPTMQSQRHELDIGSIIVSPVRYQGKILGTVTAIRSLDDLDFLDEDVELMMALGNQAGMALENVRLYEAERQYILDLQAQNEELDAFSHTVAHDLFSPLSALIGFIDLLAETSAAEGVSRQQQQMVQAVSDISRKMVTIIDEILLLAQIRKEEVQVEALDMQWIVADTRERLMYMMEEYEGELTAPETWPHILGYGPWIEEIWVNYLTNALKYGGRPPRLEMGYTMESSERVRFWVRDNGAGLSPEAQARLFTPFERLNQLNIKGHGLGLSIVRRIAEKLDGEVGVESAIGKGSLFYFTLPLSK